MLYALGSIVFEVSPLNVDEVERTGGADFAEKPILGRRPGFEFMGESARELTFRGKLFPEALGGEKEWQELEQLKSAGAAQHLIRGDGQAMGWYLIFGLRESGRSLNAQGVARVIEFEIQLKEGDPPPEGEYQGAQLGLIQ
ncbi:phage tail protein [Brevundimonas bacteroides]|uniref:phage tail protein n=1 Tax=Brevundimonas bacteroides TaxID=74311 RepID=UPI00068BA788|nr:phage tail protein [Brevundimonas bacteroides]